MIRILVRTKSGELKELEATAIKKEKKKKSNRRRGRSRSVNEHRQKRSKSRRGGRRPSLGADGEASDTSKESSSVEGGQRSEGDSANNSVLSNVSDSEESDILRYASDGSKVDDRRRDENSAPALDSRREPDCDMSQLSMPSNSFQSSGERELLRHASGKSLPQSSLFNNSVASIPGLEEKGHDNYGSVEAFDNFDVCVGDDDENKVGDDSCLSLSSQESMQLDDKGDDQNRSGIVRHTSDLSDHSRLSLQHNTANLVPSTLSTHNKLISEQSSSSVGSLSSSDSKKTAGILRQSSFARPAIPPTLDRPPKEEVVPMAKADLSGHNRLSQQHNTANIVPSTLSTHSKLISEQSSSSDGSLSSSDSKKPSGILRQSSFARPEIPPTLDQPPKEEVVPMAKAMTTSHDSFANESTCSSVANQSTGSSIANGSTGSKTRTIILRKRNTNSSNKEAETKPSDERASDEREQAEISLPQRKQVADDRSASPCRSVNSNADSVESLSTVSTVSKKPISILRKNKYSSQSNLKPLEKPEPTEKSLSQNENPSGKTEDGGERQSSRNKSKQGSSADEDQGAEDADKSSSKKHKSSRKSRHHSTDSEDKPEGTEEGGKSSSRKHKSSKHRRSDSADKDEEAEDGGKKLSRKHKHRSKSRNGASDSGDKPEEAEDDGKSSSRKHKSSSSKSRHVESDKPEETGDDGKSSSRKRRSSKHRETDSGDKSSEMEVADENGKSLAPEDNNSSGTIKMRDVAKESGDKPMEPEPPTDVGKSSSLSNHRRNRCSEDDSISKLPEVGKACEHAGSPRSNRKMRLNDDGNASTSELPIDELPNVETTDDDAEPPHNRRVGRNGREKDSTDELPKAKKTDRRQNGYEQGSMDELPEAETTDDGVDLPGSNRRMRSYAYEKDSTNDLPKAKTTGDGVDPPHNRRTRRDGSVKDSVKLPNAELSNAETTHKDADLHRKNSRIQRHGNELPNVETTDDDADPPHNRKVGRNSRLKDSTDELPKAKKTDHGMRRNGYEQGSMDELPEAETTDDGADLRGNDRRMRPYAHEKDSSNELPNAKTTGDGVDPPRNRKTRRDGPVKDSTDKLPKAEIADNSTRKMKRSSHVKDSTIKLPDPETTDISAVSPRSNRNGALSPRSRRRMKRSGHAKDSMDKLPDAGKPDDFPGPPLTGLSREDSYDSIDPPLDPDTRVHGISPKTPKTRSGAPRRRARSFGMASLSSFSSSGSADNRVTPVQRERRRQKVNIPGQIVVPESPKCMGSPGSALSQECVKTTEVEALPSPPLAAVTLPSPSPKEISNSSLRGSKKKVSRRKPPPRASSFDCDGSISSDSSSDDDSYTPSLSELRRAAIAPHKARILYKEQKQDDELRQLIAKQPSGMSTHNVDGAMLMFVNDKIFIPNDLRLKTMEHYKKRYPRSSLHFMERNCYWPSMKEDVFRFVNHGSFGTFKFVVRPVVSRSKSEITPKSPKPAPMVRAKSQMVPSVSRGRSGSMLRRPSNDKGCE